MRVELQHVSKRYGAVTALDQVDLDLPAGARVALIGPNGSGKTTLIRVLMGLAAHDGEVRLDGVPASRAPREAIAYVPQVAPQMAASVGELVRAIADVRGLGRGVISDAAGELGLDVAAIARRPFRQLSGGTKQKLLIAFALASRPRLVVLDEPTASLDADARARFVAIERARFAGATVILCSHRLDELRALVDRVVALRDGRVAADGEVAAHVARHTHSVIEVLTDGAADLLAAHGFAPAAGGWWTRAVDHAEKLALLPELIGLGARLRDLVVRDQDRLEAA